MENERKMPSSMEIAVREYTSSTPVLVMAVRRPGSNIPKALRSFCTIRIADDYDGSSTVCSKAETP